MRCAFKYCLYPDKEETVKHGTKHYHEECLKDFLHLQKVGDLYIKYYNDQESWAFMYRALYGWYINAMGAEYMVFAICQAIKEKIPLRNFMALYYIFNDGKYRERYKNRNKKYRTFEKVVLTDEEYVLLLKHMNENEVTLNYYINSLNNYMTSTGKQYSNHFATLKSWYDKYESEKPIARKDVIL
jgi:hypothetical protein